MNIRINTGLSSRFARWSLGQKIIAGYSLAFAVTITGVTTGFALSKHAQHKAHAIHMEAIEDVENVGDLQGSLVELLVRQESILNRLENSTEVSNAELKQKLAQFKEAYKEFKTNWQSLTTSDEFGAVKENHRHRHKAVENLPEPTETEAEIAASISEGYEASINDYIQQVDLLLRQVEPSAVQPEQIPQIQAGFAKLNRSVFITIKLESFIEKIAALADATSEEHRSAMALMKQASVKQVNIMLGSILLSGIGGVLVMSIISRLLLRPLEDMTQITRQSIREENFDLQVPVVSHDEAGILAENFNAHMQFVKQLLKQHQFTNLQLQATLDRLHKTQVQMIQSEKMSSLGQLVAGVAHEINNPVNFIHGNLHHVQDYVQNLLRLIQLYQHHYPTPVSEIQTEAEEIELEFIRDDLPKTLSSMYLGTDRIREIVLSLRNFSRLDEAETKSVNIHEGLDSTLMILRYRLKACPKRPEVRVIRDYATLPKIECYPGLLNQVFMNILANAIDALEEEGTKQTSCTEPMDNPGQITLSTTLIDNKWVEIAIADNGPGIPQEIQQRIFDPFFTTKPINKGTGMGMSISYQIVTEKHGGKLECFSTVGRGTKFVISIPVKQTVSWTSELNAPTEQTELMA